MIEIETYPNVFKRIADLPSQFKIKIIENTVYYVIEDLEENEIFMVNTGNSDVTILLPYAISSTYKKFFIFKSDSGSGKVFITGRDNEKIVSNYSDFETVQLINMGEEMVLFCSGSKWWKMKMFDSNDIEEVFTYFGTIVYPPDDTINYNGWRLLNYTDACYTSFVTNKKIIGITPIIIPSNSIITKIGVYVSIMETHNFTINLERISNFTPNKNILATATHTTSTTGFEEVSTTSINYAEIDNKNYSYMLSLIENDDTRTNDVYLLPPFVEYTIYNKPRI